MPVYVPLFPLHAALGVFSAFPLCNDSKCTLCIPVFPVCAPTYAFPVHVFPDLICVNSCVYTAVCTYLLECSCACVCNCGFSVCTIVSACGCLSLCDQSCVWSQVHTQIHMHVGIMIEAEPGRWPPGSSEPGITCVGDAGPVYDVVGSVESYLCALAPCVAASLCVICLLVLFGVAVGPWVMMSVSL